MSTSSSRRRFLKRAGTGILVIAAGGLVWRAADNGVFTVGDGPAYAPWRNWDSDTTGGPLALVRAGILASNAHNTQPWLFHVTDHRIDLYADTDRHLGSFDPYLREMHLSLGCALENMCLAASVNGLSATVDYEDGDLLTARADNGPVLVARLSLTPEKVQPHALYDAIPLRRTHRGAYLPDRPVDGTVHQAMQAQITDPSVKLLLVTDDQKDVLGQIITDATQTIISDKQMAEDSAAWFRMSWDKVQKHRDGVTLDAVGLPPLINAAAKILPAPSHETSDAQWLSSTRDVHVATAPMMGMLMVETLYGRDASLRAGRAWQRLHLWGAANDLAMQPLNQPLEIVDRQRQTGTHPDMTETLAAFTQSPGWAPTFIFRAGHADRSARLSPRRPLEAVTMTGA